MTENETSRGEAVGLSTMAAEHRLMHGILHELRAALEAADQGAVRELLSRFEDVARLHFMEEQSLMRLHAYPGCAAHEREHEKLLEELSELSRRIGGGEPADAARAAAALEGWLETHMQTTDAELEGYLQQHGIRTPS